MIFPNIEKTPEYRVSIPALNGGMNTEDGVSFVKDNQITACKNLWWKEGALRNRPGVFTHVAGAPEGAFGSELSRCVSQPIYLKDGRMVRFIARILSESGRKVVTCFLDAAGGLVRQDAVTFTKSAEYPQSIHIFSGKATNGCGIYMMAGYEKGGVVYELGDSYEDWTKLSWRDMYVPTVLINGKGNKYETLPASTDTEYAKPSTLEGFNLLSGAFKATYTTDGVSDTFYLPDVTLNPYSGADITFENHKGTVYTFRIWAGYKVSPEYTTSREQEVSMRLRQKKEDGTWEETEVQYTMRVRYNRIFKRLEFEQIRDSGEPVSRALGVGRRANNLSVVVHADQSEQYTQTIQKYFTADGKSNALQLQLSNLDPDEEVRIEYYAGLNFDVTEMYTITIPAKATKSDDTEIRYQVDFYASVKNWPTETVYAQVDRETATVTIYDAKTDAPYALPMQGFYQNEPTPDNIVVTASVHSSSANIFKMNRSVWFGGQSGGLTRGSRLFMCGDPDQPNLVRWSDLDNPLYFPENNYAYIGESGQPVTGFGRQGEALVFFKPHELYYTNELQDEDLTVEDVLAGRVPDITVKTFPVFQIHGSIGCDCPETIQLCDNRLVWAHSSGRIYALTGLNVYSERNVSELSRHIGSSLKDCDWANAWSADWNNHYMLFVNNSSLSASTAPPLQGVFLLDYTCEGFQMVVSGGEYQSPPPLKWYAWELPIRAENVVCDGVGLSGLCVRAANTDAVWLLTEKLYQDAKGGCTLTPPNGTYEILEGADFVYPAMTGGARTLYYIETYLRTKLFDFGKPERIKGVPAVYIDIGCSRDCIISYISERGETDGIKHVNMFMDGSMQQAGFLQTVKLLPQASRVRRFGLGIRASGAVALNGLALRYKIMGV